MYQYDAGHTTKMAAMLIYGKKKPSNIFFSGTGGQMDCCQKVCSLWPETELMKVSEY